MGRRSDIKKVLIIGSGPITIGQACEFDYSGTQACKALMAEGLEVVLVNSNPATIMTDPEIATRVYVEPLSLPFLEKIIELERPDSVIPTLGGQTALNLALELHAAGTLEKFGCRLLGADPKVIKAAEDRELFKEILVKIGAGFPASEMIRDYDSGLLLSEELGFPLILRPNYTLGGAGGGIAYSLDEYKLMLNQALHESPTSEVLVEASILGWKEFELEVMRDSGGTFVVVCSIENFDPCGVHTGDSITVAPQQTLSDREYQAMRDEACRIVEEVGVQTGGANVQFAVHPTSGKRVVIEMNPRVSRSSALASKATGFPIAKIAALLAIGYQLHEITNDITRVTPTCFEPSLDYVVTKIPRFAFEKFPGVKDLLTTQMKSVGEVMGIGRTFAESLMKAISSLELSSDHYSSVNYDVEKVSYPNSLRLFHVIEAFRKGRSVEFLNELTQIHPWFLEQVERIVQVENQLQRQPLDKTLLQTAKRMGLTDQRIGQLTQQSELAIRDLRHSFDLHPGYFQVDTCAGEFKSNTPYFYSTYWTSYKPQVNWSKTIVVLGSGPNRIGQGIEFDYSCVRGVKALQKAKYQVVMINSNPETVSTDYDTADSLFFEPLIEETVIEIMNWVKPLNFVAQLGGQTPLNLAPAIEKAGYKILGTTLASIDLAEDRSQFIDLCREFGFKSPVSTIGRTAEEIRLKAQQLGYPIICRPSYVLGGRKMEVLEKQEELDSYLIRHSDSFSQAKPLQIDQFLEGALEVDVDLVRGVDWTVIGGVLEHIEAAGVHSGDSMGVLPPQRLKDSVCLKIEEMSLRLADRIGILGHLNLQLAVKNDEVYILEANPRSSRSVPFLVKATGIPLVDLGIKASLGLRSREINPNKYNWRNLEQISVKGVVFPFKKFKEADSILGPEMKSTGETMGRGPTYPEALMKAFLASSIKLPPVGEVFFSLRDKDKASMYELALQLVQNGYSLSGTKGTADYFNQRGLTCLSLKKMFEGRPHCVDHIRSGKVAFVINTTMGKQSIQDSFEIRRACIERGIPCLTESDAAHAFCLALQESNTNNFTVAPLRRTFE